MRRVGLVGLCLWGLCSGMARDARADGGAAVRATLGKPAFTATAGELLAAARIRRVGSYEMLHHTVALSFDERGRATRRRHEIYVASDAETLELLGSVSAEWLPERDDRPTIRARVISPDGQIHPLDPGSLTDDGKTYHELGGKLPGLELGAVIELETVVTERALPSRGGVFALDHLMSYAAGGAVMTVEAPAALRLHVVQHGGVVRARHEALGARERWTYEVTQAWEAQYERGTAPERPYVGVTTAPDWASVARAERAVLDRQIAAGPPRLLAGMSIEPRPPSGSLTAGGQPRPSIEPRPPSGSLTAGGQPRPSTPTMATVRTAVDWVHRTIASDARPPVLARVPPAPPAIVIQRRRGDAVERATLLVALLRQAKIPADVVRFATEAEPDSALPGLAALDGVVVRARVGSAEIWLDPRDRNVRPGELRHDAYDRVALVIADDTRGLSRTPALTSAASVEREVRTYTIPEAGSAHVTELRRTTGILEAHRRAAVRLRNAAGLAEDRQHRAHDLFEGDAESGTTTDVDDLVTPFTETLVVRDAARVHTEGEQIAITITPRDALTDASELGQPGPRRHDFVWEQPHRHEIEHRIAIPDGFTPPSPSHRVVALGPASYREELRVDPAHHLIVVTQQLDTGKRRISAAEYTAMSTAIAALRDKPSRYLLQLTARAYADAGKLPEAIAELRRRIAQAPRSVVRHEQLAKLLFEAGLGVAGRREARAAIALAPADADAHAYLGWALLHDSFGRYTAFDWDRAGALAEFHKALALDAHNDFAARFLAFTLERGADGLPITTTDARYAALDARRAAYKLTPDSVSALALARDLMATDAFTAAETAARAADPGPARDGVIVAALAARDGAEPALQAAHQLAPDDAHELLDTAGWALMYKRRYDVGRALLVAGQDGKPLAPQLAGVAVHAAVRQGTADPRLAAIDAMLSLIAPSRKTAVFWDDRVAGDARADLGFHYNDTPDEQQFYADVLQTSTPIEVAGGKGVWRVQITLDDQVSSLFLVLDRGAAKLLGASHDHDLPAGVGRYLMRAGAGRPAVARQLLDWIFDDTFDPQLTSWRPGLARTPAAIELAASHLVAMHDPTPAELERVVAVATRCATNLPEPQTACRLTLAIVADHRQQWAELAVALDQIEARGRPDSLPALYMGHLTTLLKLGRFDDAERIARLWAAAAPDDHDARWAPVRVAVRRGDHAEAIRRADAVVAAPDATLVDTDRTAWLRLWTGRELPRALALAQKAIAAEPNADRYNTLALIELELGNLSAAAPDAQHGVAGEIPPSSAWYLQGRLSEQLGLTADAITAYQQIQLDDNYLPDVELAKRRLAVLQPKP